MMQLLPFIFRASQAIPELDFAGTIVEVGTNVPAERGLAVGTEVFGSMPLVQHVKSISGALTEYIVLECGAVVEKPDGMPLKEAAGLGVSGCTALDLIKAAKLKTGDSVLVNGAGGGIGHLAMQMCREKVGETGKVVAVCSSRNVDWVKGLGADEVSVKILTHAHLLMQRRSSLITKIIQSKRTSQRLTMDLGSTP